MSYTTQMECQCCGFDTDCIEGLCEPCNDFNHIFQKQIDEARRKLVAIKEQRDELLAVSKEAFLVLTEPGIMDVKKWKGWRKLTVAKLREAIEQAEKGSE